jgi:hypothetical protein
VERDGAERFRWDLVNVIRGLRAASKLVTRTSPENLASTAYEATTHASSPALLVAPSRCDFSRAWGQASTISGNPVNEAQAEPWSASRAVFLRLRRQRALSLEIRSDALLSDYGNSDGAMVTFNSFVVGFSM